MQVVRELSVRVGRVTVAARAFRGVAGWLAVLALVACSGDDSPPATDGAPPSSAPATQPPTQTSVRVLPLTGEPAAEGVPDRPVLVVKVDNTAGARPQRGLSAADLIVEELVEGGLTRLAVMYHSALPDLVAPVRSVRTSDVAIVAPTGGALVASGGAGRVLDVLDDAGLVVVAEGAAGISRDSSRRSPYNVVAEPAEVLGEIVELGSPAQPYLPWAAPDAVIPAGSPAAEVSVRFSRGHTTRWEWTGDVWHRVNDLATEGEAFTPDTVLVLRVTTRDAGYLDPAGNPVPETVLEGSGDALLLIEGQAVEARWSKAGAGSPVELTDADGARLPVPPGKTWIELVPEGGEVTLG